MVAKITYLFLTYLLAAVPFGVVVTTIWGGDVDLRAAGSGNIGATNVARVFGWRIAAPVLGLDALKGFLPVMLAWAMWPDAGTVWLGTVAIVAFIGHCWPVYLEFRGGKGVATGAGGLLALAPAPTLLGIAIWALLLGVTGKSSVAALGATTAMIAIAAWLAPEIVVVAALLALGVAIRHVTNIGRIVRGEEPEMVRPVRWGRSGAVGPTADEVLHQDPAGGSTAVPAWKRRDDE